VWWQLATETTSVTRALEQQRSQEAHDPGHVATDEGAKRVLLKAFEMAIEVICKRIGPIPALGYYRKRPYLVPQPQLFW